jgi:hypothetical protein
MAACPGRQAGEHRVESCHIAVSADDMAVTTVTGTTSCRTLTTGAEPPCGWHSVTKLGLKRCKGKNYLTRILDSKVGSSN